MSFAQRPMDPIGAGADGSSCVCECAPHPLELPTNRAGRDNVAVRLGNYSDFFGAALERLSGADLPALRALGSRDSDDPAIAWLDAWAIAADVLTFYRERLTNEGYLRTATDERALRELAALVGFQPRPGVAATAYLAYQLDKTAAPVEIPAGAKAQTIPAPGEQMQTFETEEKFVARAEWSQMVPRLSRPARITLIDALVRDSLRLADATLLVRPGERVLFIFDSAPGFQVMREIAAARADVQGGFVELQLKPHIRFDPTKVEQLLGQLVALRGPIAAKIDDPDSGAAFKLLLEAISSYFLGGSEIESLARVARVVEPNPPNDPELLKLATDLGTLFKAIIGGLPDIARNVSSASSLATIMQAVRSMPPVQLLSGRRLPRSVQNLGGESEDRLRLLKSTTPELAVALPAALNSLRTTGVSSDVAPTVYLLRATAGAFGALAPPPAVVPNAAGVPPEHSPPDHPLDFYDKVFCFLDAVYDRVDADSFVVFARPDTIVKDAQPDKKTVLGMEMVLRIARVRSAQVVSRGAYGIAGKSTRLELVSLDGREPIFVIPQVIVGSIDGTPAPQGPDLSMLRHTSYYVQSEAVRLADDLDTGDLKGDHIELQVRVEELQAGQWLIVTGERTDIVDANGVAVRGVRSGELAMISAVTQQADPNAPGDTLHTVITLAKPLGYSYVRGSAFVFGNVVKASHGETVADLLGSGDASRVGQRFALSRPPLTFTTASTPAGVASSESVRVGGVRYQRVESLLDADAPVRAYQLDVDETGTATLTFGDGDHGARLPSGSQNVRATYRIGIGSAGNVRPEQISLLTTRPLGVTGVINPLRASGGADRDDAERIRRNVPLATQALAPLSRLVSVADYESFALRFGGIGHAAAVRITDGAQQIVHVTVAGVADNPLDAEGELLANLRAAYVQFGDPSYPVEVAVRELKILVVEARVAIEDDADWDKVKPALERRLLDYFSFDRRRLAQPAYLSEAIAAMQGTPGVAWVDVDRFGGITESETRDSTLLDQAIGKLDLAGQVEAESARANPLWTPGSGLRRVLPAVLAFMPSDVPGALALNLV